jgi:hypothetical protein
MDEQQPSGETTLGEHQRCNGALESTTLEDAEKSPQCREQPVLICRLVLSGERSNASQK